MGNALIDRLLRRAPLEPAPALRAYRAAVAAARAPDWYLTGGVDDSVDGRFDMVALMTSLLLVRLEAEGSATAALQAEIIECFVDDMDASIREMGIGDMVVAKHVGRMTGALGGRLGAYRRALAADDLALGEALARNLYRGDPPSRDALAWTVARARRIHDRLQAQPAAALAAGDVAFAP